MPADHEALVDAITTTVPLLLTTMEAIEQVQRNLHPTHHQRLGEAIAPFATDLANAAERFRALEFPDDIAALRDRLDHGLEYALRACDGLTRHEEGFGALMKAMRAQCRAQEYVFGLTSVLTPVSQYFLEVEARENRTLLEALQAGAGRENTGLMSARNERETRGGFSLYIPEHLDETRPASLVVAMHGGTGHGADFLWSWVREARTRRFIVMAPTSQQDTWSLMGEEHDLGPLRSMIEHVKGLWPIDDEHILATGMSDGGTYALIAGLAEQSPFTHIAPFSGVLHPQLSADGSLARAAGKPVYLVHGTEDWMFPIEAAQMARHELESAGAKLTYREIEGLSHTYARSEHPALIPWFNPELVIPK